MESKVEMKSQINDGVLIKVDEADIKNGVFFCEEATSVVMNAFNVHCTVITISLPNVTTINSLAFNRCPDLTGCHIPQVQRLWSHAFSHCKNLTVITISKNIVAEYDSITFCNNLKRVIISNTTQPENLNTIRKGLPECLRYKEIILKSDAVRKLVNIHEVLDQNVPKDVSKHILNIGKDLFFKQNKGSEPEKPEPENQESNQKKM